MKKWEKESWKWEAYKLHLEVQRFSHFCREECSGAVEMFKNQKERKEEQRKGCGEIEEGQRMQMIKISQQSSQHIHFSCTATIHSTTPATCSPPSILVLFE